MDALVDASTGHSLSYRALAARVARLARALEERGVTRGDRVAMLAASRAEVFEVLLACGRLGAAFVPLNGRLSSPELAAIARDAAPALFVHESAREDADAVFAGAAATVRARLVLDGPPGPDAYETSVDEASPAAPRFPDDAEIAMLLYTSGTTGRPRGVMLAWRQVRFNAHATIRRCALRPADRCLAFLPLFHTGGLNCLALPLLTAGGTVIVTPRFDAAEALAAIATHRVTAIVGVPVMYQRLLEAGAGGPDLARLRVRLVGGAPCPPVVRAAFGARGLPLWHGYGLTEVGPNCFSFGLGDDPSAPDTVGTPAPGTEARLAGDEGRAPDPGAVGELWLRGPHVTAGYWGKPDETAASLDADGWFHTGDLARRDPEGRFTIVGRQKEMYISGGENVYPAEVERVLAEHPDVLEAAVTGVPDASWGEVGLAALVLRAGTTLDAAMLRVWARGRLAAYKIPRHVRIVDALPRNAAGKVLHGRLRALAPCGSHA